MGSIAYNLDDISKFVFDDTSKLRCDGSLNNVAYKDLTSELGGMQWGDSIPTSYQDLELPVFGVRYGGDSGPGYNSSSANGGGNMSVLSSADSASSKQALPPSISRADKIGRAGNKIVYLSEKYGLFFVDVSGEKPSLSCSVPVPGRPKNFYIIGSKIHLLTQNNWSASTSTAIISYGMKGNKLSYTHHTVLKDQELIDSRLFNSTLAVYSRYGNTSSYGYQNGGGNAASKGVFIADSAVKSMSSDSYKSESMLTVVKILESSYEKAFEDLFSDVTETMRYQHEATAADVGKVISRYSSPLSFISASDRYLIVGRLISETVVDRIEQVKSYHTTCTAYNPKFLEVTLCVNLT